LYSLELDSNADSGQTSSIKFGNIFLIRRNIRYLLLNIEAWIPSDRFYRYLTNLTIPKSLKNVSTVSKVAFDLVKAWLKQCITHHDGCVIQNGGPYFTLSRLLMITKYQDTDTV
jgi:hypothetical protein